MDAAGGWSPATPPIAAAVTRHPSLQVRASVLDARGCNLDRPPPWDHRRPHLPRRGAGRSTARRGGAVLVPPSSPAASIHLGAGGRCALAAARRLYPPGNWMEKAGCGTLRRRRYRSHHHHLGPCHHRRRRPVFGPPSPPYDAVHSHRVRHRNLTFTPRRRRHLRRWPPGWRRPPPRPPSAGPAAGFHVRSPPSPQPIASQSPPPPHNDHGEHTCGEAGENARGGGGGVGRGKKRHSTPTSWTSQTGSRKMTSGEGRIHRSCRPQRSFASSSPL